jgi:hypothetical protein
VGMELCVHVAIALAQVTVVDVRKSDCTAKSNHTILQGNSPLYEAFPAGVPELAKGQKVSSQIPSARGRQR